MAFKPEPPFSHAGKTRTALLFCNLGTPEAATAPALRRYLAEFLGDGRVVEIPKAIWWLILHGIILRVRPAKSAAKYASIWTEQGSPLAVTTRAQAEALAQALHAQGHDLIVRHAMRYGSPSVADQLDALKREGVTRILWLPAYPQYSASTTASVWDAAYRWGLQTRWIPEMRFINHYHDHPDYIESLARSVRSHWQAHGRAACLVMSFHGVPARTLELGDPYYCECMKTGRLLAEALQLDPSQYRITFQSRFGKARWLEPYTEPTVRELAQKGVQDLQVICPGFTSDCLETLEEIRMEVRDAFMESGGKRFEYIECLNTRPDWIEGLARICTTHLAGWDTGPTPSSVAEQRARLAKAQGASQ